MEILRGKRGRPRKKPSSPPHRSYPSNPLSFFKIMIGAFEESMFIPPKFCCTIRGLVKQNVYLEDSDGHSWTVKIASVDGSLAFEQGWHRFVLDHSIKTGELVIFKYIGGSRFSAQIFGRSACERVYFHKKNISGNCKKKRNVIDIPQESSRLPKRLKISEASEDRFEAVNTKSVKKQQETEDAPGKSSGIRTAAKNLVSKGAKNILHTHDKSSHYDNRSKEPQTAFPLNYSEGPCHLFDGDAFREKEANRISRGNLHGAACDIVDKVISDPRVTKEKERLVINESKLSDQADQANSPITSMMALAVGCTNHDEGNLIMLEEMGEKLLLTENGICHALDENLMDELCVPIVLPGGKKECSVYQHENAAMLEEIGQKFLVTEDGLCYIGNEILVDELNEGRVTPIDSFVSEKEGRVYQDDKEATPKVPCIEPLFDSVEKTSAIEEIRENAQQNGKYDTDWDGSGGCAPRSRTNIHKYHNDPYTFGGNTHQSGEWKNKVIKTETMGSIDGPLSNSVHFRFSLPFQAQSWLKLPQRLSSVGKRRFEKKVVILRDPSSRLWPVLYHESNKFVGFIGGWQDFVSGNNLRKGDLCTFDVVNGSELTLQVWVSRL